MLPLLIADPRLPEEVRRTLADEPEEGARQLVELGLSSCSDAAELAGVTPTDVCCCSL